MHPSVPHCALHHARQACLELATECRLLALGAAMDAGACRDGSSGFEEAAAGGSVGGSGGGQGAQGGGTPEEGAPAPAGECIPADEGAGAAADAEDPGGCALALPTLVPPAGGAAGEEACAAPLDGRAGHGGCGSSYATRALWQVAEEDAARLQSYEATLHAHVARVMRRATAATLFR